MNRWLSARAKAYQVRKHIETKLNKELYGRELLLSIVNDESLLLIEVPANDPLLGGENDNYCQATYRPEANGYSAITINKESSPESYLLYLAHELGHHFLHTRYDVCADDDVNPERIILTVPYAEGRVATYNPYQLQENEANIFAAELLMPSQRLAEKFDMGMNVEELMNYFHVSKYGLFNQLVNVVLEPEVDFENYIHEKGNETFHWENLDASQKDAACISQGPIRVDAGPGTGKTRTLTGRVEWLLENHTPPEEIVVLTFSNKATDELRQRLRAVVPKQVHQITVATFHGFGVELLRRYGSYKGLQKDFTILDPVDTENLLGDHLDQLQLMHYADPVNPEKYFGKTDFGGSIPGFITRIKQELITPEIYDAHIEQIMSNDLSEEDGERYREIGYVYQKYEQLKRQLNVVDYDDLIMLPTLIVRENLQVLQQLQSQYKHILVDEFQDINRANGELIQLLAGKGDGLWVVGDLRQSIYRWRGASPKYLRNFQEYYPQADTKYLKTNYRATEQVINYINACTPNLLLNNEESGWVSYRGKQTESHVELVSALSSNHEHYGVIRKISELRAKHNYRYSDYAILCRTHKIAMEFAQALEASNIPVLHFGDYHERPEVKDLLAVVDLVANSQGISWIRIAQNLEKPLSFQQASDLWKEVRTKKQLFPEALNTIAESDNLSSNQTTEIIQLKDMLLKYRYAHQANPWLIMSEYLFSFGRYLRNLRQNLQTNMPKLLAIGHLMNIARSHSQRKPLNSEQSRANSFLNHVRSLIGREDDDVPIPSLTAGIDGVSILTIHKAKGLEFPVIFVPRIDITTFTPRARGDDIMPIPKDLLTDIEDNVKDLEERSGLFVAISRARNHLILSYPYRQNNGYKRNPSTYWEHLQYLGAFTTTWDEPLDNIALGTKRHLEAIKLDPSINLSFSAVRRLSYCPRQFYYQDVMQLTAFFRRGIYLDFHNAVSETIEWLQQHVEEGQEITTKDIVSKFEAEFSKHVSDQHSHRNWYQSQGIQQIKALYDDMQLRYQNNKVQYKVSKLVQFAGLQVEITIDEINYGEDSYEAIHYRVAKAHKGDLRTYMYRQALKDRNGKSLRISIYSLFDNQKNESDMKKEDEKAKQLTPNIELVLNKEYPPEPAGKWLCASCPYLFICPR